MPVGGCRRAEIPGEEAQDGQHQQPDDAERHGEGVEAEAAGHAERAHDPDARAGGGADDLEPPLDDGGRTEKPDRANDRLHDTHGIDLHDGWAVPKQVHQLQRHEAEACRAQRHHHVGAQAQRLVSQLTIEADYRTERYREHEADDRFLDRDVRACRPIDGEQPAQLRHAASLRCRRSGKRLPTRPVPGIACARGNPFHAEAVSFSLWGVGSSTMRPNAA